MVAALRKEMTAGVPGLIPLAAEIPAQRAGAVLGTMQNHPGAAAASAARANRNPVAETTMAGGGRITRAIPIKDQAGARTASEQVPKLRVNRECPRHHASAMGQSPIFMAFTPCERLT